MKVRKLSFVLTILLVAQIVYFVWMPFPKCIIDFSDSEIIIFDIFTSLIWFSCLAIILLFSVKSLIGSEKVFKVKHYLAAIATCTLTQLLIDSIIIFDAFYFYTFREQYSAVFWFVSVMVMCWISGYKSVNKKRFFIISICSLVALFFVFTVVRVGCTIHTDISDFKYVSQSYEYKSKELNSGFFYGINNAVIDYLYAAAMFVALTFSVMESQTAENERTSKREYGRKFVARLVSVAIISFAVCGFKVLIMPHSALKTIERSINTTEKDGFYEDTDIVELTRSTGYFNEGETVFARSKITLLYDGNKLLSYNMDGVYHSTETQLEGNQIIMEENLKKYDVNGTEVFVSFDSAVAYMKDGVPYAVELKKIDKEPEDEVLLGICKTLISEGNFASFEYTCAYVNLYDQDFVKPYLERYAKGEFTDEELEKNENISSIYIAEVARQYVNLMK